MEKLILRLQEEYPQFIFKSGRVALWSPAQKCITYVKDDDDKALWATLHELGHALSDHSTYDSDMILIRKEAEAWEKAIEVSRQYGVKIDEEHIQDCLDTYRDWLFKRSTCPTCEGHGIQATRDAYGCYNCNSSWRVGNKRFCRPYRALSIK